jgi:hypothetical protein
MKVLVLLLAAAMAAIVAAMPTTYDAPPAICDPKAKPPQMIVPGRYERCVRSDASDAVDADP